MFICFVKEEGAVGVQWQSWSIMHRARTFTTLSIVIALLALTTAQNSADKLGVKPTNGAPARTPIKALPLTSRQTRPKRFADDVITDCFAVKAGPGKYFIKAESGMESACDLFLAAMPEQLIQVRFDEFDVACEDGGKVSFVDGWEIRQQLYPNPQDHNIPFDQRTIHFCGKKKISTRLVSSQNAAMIRYTLPRRGDGFTITVKHVMNNEPCNVIAADEIIFTLKNYGDAKNCSVTGMYSGKVEVLQYDIPVDNSERRRYRYRSYRRQDYNGEPQKNCRKRGSGNYLQIGGTEKLDATAFVVAEDFCGTANKPSTGEIVVACKITVARLISNGNTDISATIGMKRLEDGDELNARAICQD